MDIKNCIFPFKGDRNYVQGPDLFNAMISAFPNKELSKIRFSAHGFLSVSNCFLYISKFKDDIDKVEGVETRCQLNVNEETHWLALTPGEPIDDVNRQSYDEESLIAQCVIDEDWVALNGDSPYTFIETIVSMNKHLLQKLFSDEAGKWIFTRIDLPELSVAKSKISLQFKHNMNFRLLKSDILVEGKKVGDLYFSLVK